MRKTSGERMALLRNTVLWLANWTCVACGRRHDEAAGIKVYAQFMFDDESEGSKWRADSWRAFCWDCGEGIRHEQWVERVRRRAIRDEVFARDGGRCLVCGSPDNLTYDHVVPKSAGGQYTVENGQTLCRPCNADKADGTTLAV